MSMRRFTIFLVAPIFAFLCDGTLLHRRFLIIALVAYYFCTFLLTQFRSLFAVTAVILFREAFVAGCEPAVNTAAFAKLSAVYGSFSETRFGAIRLWGSVGWGVTSLFVPIVCDKLFNASLVPVLYAQVLIGIPVVLLLFNAVDLSPRLFLDAQQKPTAYPENQEAIDTRPARSPMLAILCVFAAFEQGVVLGATQTTLLIYLARIGVSSALIGLSVFVGCSAEGCMFFADRWVRCFVSNEKRVIQFGIVLNAISLSSYAMLHYIPKDSICRVVMILGTEFVGGVGYALFMSSILQMADRVAPSEWQTGGQGVVTSVMYGVGPALGAILGGWAFEAFGIKMVFGSMVAFNALTILIFGC